MGALTVEQLIEDGLGDLGVAAIDEPLEPEYVKKGLTKFNMFIDSWKAQRLAMHEAARKLFDVSANVASYSIGPSGTWPLATAPQAIIRAGFVNTAVNPTTPLETPIHVYTDEEYFGISLKSTTSTIVWGVWYETDFTNNGQTPPNGLNTVHVYPIITISAKVALYVPIPIEEVSDDETVALPTIIVVPPGYRKAMSTTLAMEMADVFGITPSDNLVAKWKMAMKVVKRSNSKPATLRLPKALTRRGRDGSGYNILTNN